MQEIWGIKYVGHVGGRIYLAFTFLHVALNLQGLSCDDRELTDTDSHSATAPP